MLVFHIKNWVYLWIRYEKHCFFNVTTDLREFLEFALAFMARTAVYFS